MALRTKGDKQQDKKRTREQKKKTRRRQEGCGSSGAARPWNRREQETFLATAPPAGRRAQGARDADCLRRLPRPGLLADRSSACRFVVARCICTRRDGALRPHKVMVTTRYWPLQPRRSVGRGASGPIASRVRRRSGTEEWVPTIIMIII